MAFVEEIQNALKQHPSLSFVDLLLRDHKNAELFLVGGALRDSLLRRPIGDMDFVIRGIELDAIIAWLQKHGTADVVGKTFGVIKFRPHSRTPLLHKEGQGMVTYDIALPRTEQSLPNSLGGYRDSSVQSDPNLSIEDDLARRDFTINAMAYDVRNQNLIDPFRGQDDLEKKWIRAVGDPSERFREDLTRILRAVRFAAQLHFAIEPSTLEAIKKCASELNRIKKTDGKNSYVVARETIGEELAKAFSSQPFFTACTLEKTGLLEELFPGVARSLHLDPHYFVPLGKLEEGHRDLAIMLFMRGLTGEETQTAIRFTGLDTLAKSSPYRLHTERIVWVVSKLHGSPSPDDVVRMRTSQFEKQVMSEHGRHHLKALTYLENNAVAQAAQKRRDEICARWNCEDREPIPVLLGGDDLLRLGIPAGVRVREILEDVRDRQLDGHLLTREAALAWVRKLIDS